MNIQTMMPTDRKKADSRLGRLAYGSLFCLVVPAAMALWLGRLDRFMPALAMPGMVWGSAAIAAGLTIMAWSMLVLIRQGRGQPMNAYPTQAWVSAGPFQIVSHPIYVGFVITVAGVAIVARSIAGLYVGVPVAAASATALVLGYEGLATRLLTGLGRFAEEGMRGEPQTPVWRGLSLYHWLCSGLVAAGMAVTFLPGAGALTSPVSPGLGGIAIAASISLLWVVGLSVDWPWTGWRFSRLAPLCCDDCT